MSPETKYEGFVGVDGCRGGWTASTAKEPIAVFQGFEEIVKKYKKKMILVDLPIGLPNTTRDLDRLARKKFDVSPLVFLQFLAALPFTPSPIKRLVRSMRGKRAKKFLSRFGILYQKFGR